MQVTSKPSMLQRSGVPQQLRALRTSPRVQSKGHVVHSAASNQQAPAEHTKSFTHGVTYTSYEVNTFSMKFNSSGARVLVDPWFVGDLTFLDQDWLYRGKKRVVNRTLTLDVQQIMNETDVVVITQGLDDHCHMPTLRILPREIPIVCNPMAADRIKPLGYKDVRVLDHGQTIDVADGKLQIVATVGALVGPPWSKRQNGLLFKEKGSRAGEQGATVYFESHCDFDPASVAQAGKVDMVISPFTSSYIGVSPAAYPLTMGDINLVKLLKILRPQVVVPLLNSDIDHSGPLAAILEDKTLSAEQLRAEMAAAGLDVRVEYPAPPGEAVAIAL